MFVQWDELKVYDLFVLGMRSSFPYFYLSIVGLGF